MKAKRPRSGVVVSAVMRSKAFRTRLRDIETKFEYDVQAAVGFAVAPTVALVETLSRRLTELEGQVRALEIRKRRR